MKNKMEEEWDIVISPKTTLLKVSIKELIQYKDLIYMFVKRDLVAFYKQTILGPLWFILQPAITTLIYWIIFSKIANISTNGIPSILFYLSGIVFWNYFASVVTKVSDTFTLNASVFGKVYFPRLTVPISIVLSSFITFFIQFLFGAIVLLYLVLMKNWTISFTGQQLFVFIIDLILIALWGLGLGVLITALSSKYRDVKYLLTFGLQLLMYATPVVYPITLVTNNTLKWLLYFNPMTVVIESFRCVYIQGNAYDTSLFILPIGVVLSVLLLGIVFFNRIEKTFMDTV